MNTIAKNYLNNSSLLKILLLLSAMIFSNHLFGQYEIWYFGDNGAGKGYGLDFSGGTPVLIGNGSPKQPKTNFYETVSVISDGAGNVKFYSNGIYIWDTDGNKMPNSALPLKGSIDAGTTASAVQGALTIKIPNTTDKYLVFTTQSVDNGTPQNGIKVHRVNMSLPGNGTALAPKGDLEMRDSVLELNKTSEMLSAYGNCDSVWVIGHIGTPSYDFVVFLVTKDGVVKKTTQSISTLNTWNNGFSDGAMAAARGSIAFNPQGTQLAMTGQWPIGTHIMDFNKYTGVLSNPVMIKDSTGVEYDGYGTEWSPDGKKLYVSSLAEKIMQYNVTTAKSTWVSASIKYAEIVRGKDNKLYVGRVLSDNKQYLAVIANPDAATGSASGFSENGIFVGSSVSYAMPQTFDCSMVAQCPAINLSAVAPFCAGVNLNLSALVNGSTPSGTWSIQSGSGGSISVNNFSATQAGTFTLRYTLNSDPGGSCAKYGEITFTVNSGITISIADQFICSGQSAVFDAGVGYSTYQWSGLGTGNLQTTPASAPGIYTVSVTDGSGCSGTANASLALFPKPNVSMNNDSICEGDNAAVFDAGAGFNSYVWSNNGSGTAQTTSGTIAGTYTVVVTTNEGCKDTSFAELIVHAKPSVALSNAIICEGDSAVVFDAGASFASYTWSDLGTGNTQSTWGALAGNYTVTVATVNGCKDTATATLIVNALPLVALADNSVCAGGSIQLFPIPNNFVSYEWHTSATTSSINYNAPNTVVWVKVTDANNCSDTAFAQISNGDTLHVDFGGDTQICQNESLVLNASQFGPFQGTVTYTWDNIPGSSSRTITQAGSYGVVVMDGRGCAGSDTIQLLVNPLPVIKLGNDTAVCFTGKEIFTHSLTAKYSSIQWSNGSVDTMFIQNTAGPLSIVVSNDFGCEASDTIVVNEYCEPTVICFPNVITPNGDGINDDFIAMECPHVKIDDENYKGFIDNLIDIHFVVINRWGIKMFESEDVMPLWDGTFNGEAVSTGVYFWIVNYTDSAHQNHEQTGWVEVLK